MESSITPDAKYKTKIIYIHAIVTAVFILAAVIGSAILNATNPPPDAPEVVLIGLGIGLALLWLIIFPLVSLWIGSLSYELLEDRVTLHSGILTKTEQNIPFRAVTDFVLERSLFDRFLGIGTIKIQTAGQSSLESGYEGTLVGLLEYEKLHNELRDRMKAMHQPTGPTTTSEAPAEGEVFAAMLTELRAIRNALEKD